MEESRASQLRFVASQLVFVAALIHVGRGFVEWSNYAIAGFFVPPDFRWPAFVISGGAVMVGLWLAYRAESKRHWYLLGVLAMLGYVFAYYAWHLTGHQLLLTPGGSAPSHEVTVGLLLEHYLAGPFETITLTVELLAAALLSVLYVFEE